MDVTDPIEDASNFNLKQAILHGHGYPSQDMTGQNMEKTWKYIGHTSLKHVRDVTRRPMDATLKNKYSWQWIITDLPPESNLAD